MAKSIAGTVSSIAGNKTIVITSVWRRTHPLYKKQYSISSKYMAHDEKNECKVGDKVTIQESKPLSARKRYILKEITQRTILSQDDLAVISKDETAAKLDSKSKSDDKDSKEDDK
jgi:small subunit ribosomal protein S17